MKMSERRTVIGKHRFFPYFRSLPPTSVLFFLPAPCFLNLPSLYGPLPPILPAFPLGFSLHLFFLHFLLHPSFPASLSQSSSFSLSPSSTLSVPSSPPIVISPSPLPLPLCPSLLTHTSSHACFPCFSCSVLLLPSFQLIFHFLYFSSFLIPFISSFFTFAFHPSVLPFLFSVT